ncbi:MAG: adenosylcobinamide-GDP ribazoletransferase [Chloroherpetonaceae bacterium]|nr:adenosylcobinamide-GDP ribazoletransferase [Chloroherpetonaceae bacterium]
MTRLRELWQEWLSALMFYTRLPVSGLVHHTPERLQRSRKFFPWVGVLVGFLVSLFLIGALIFLPVMPAVVLSIAASLLITGAFHEDGFADVCDGFGGGWRKDRILEIMKDSRIGVFGTAGLFVILTLKISLLISLIDTLLLKNTFDMATLSLSYILIFAYSFSRFAASLVVELSTYVQDFDASKSKPIATSRLSLVSHLFGIFPLILLSVIFFAYDFHVSIGEAIPLQAWTTAIALSLLLSLISMLVLKRFFEQHIGGYTGDCLGAVQQVSEVIIYISFLSAFHSSLYHLG